MRLLSCFCFMTVLVWVLSSVCNAALKWKLWYRCWFFFPPCPQDGNRGLEVLWKNMLLVLFLSWKFISGFEKLMNSQWSQSFSWWVGIQWKGKGRTQQTELTGAVPGCIRTGSSKWKQRYHGTKWGGMGVLRISSKLGTIHKILLRLLFPSSFFFSVPIFGCLGLLLFFVSKFSKMMYL